MNVDHIIQKQQQQQQQQQQQNHANDFSFFA